MADMMSRLKEILGDGAEDKIKNAVDMLTAGSLNRQKRPVKVCPMFRKKSTMILK